MVKEKERTGKCQVQPRHFLSSVEAVRVVDPPLGLLQCTLVRMA